MRDLVREELWVVLLDTRNRVVKTQAIYKGSLNTSIVRAAAALSLAHNQPSGDPFPSPEDIRVTREIVQAGNFPLLDHLIIGQNAYNSLKERGLGFDVG